MPSHWSSPELHIVTGSSPTGTQFVQAAGCAHASSYVNPGSDEVTLVCTGEGATSEGEFWECMNAACLEKLPLLVLVEDNGFAISVPVEAQTAGGSISALLRSFPDLFIAQCDGTDFLESFQAMSDAVSYCRSGRGPALVHARCTRPYSHSLSDDERLYKTAAERASEASRDPLVTISGVADPGRNRRPSASTEHHRGGRRAPAAGDAARSARRGARERDNAPLSLFRQD